MNVQLTQRTSKTWLASLLLTACLVTASSTVTAQAAVIPPHSKPHGKSYSEWSAAWWQWALSQPVAGHPFIDDPAFDVTAGQSGQVWFLGAPFGTVQRDITVPAGKMLFIAILNAEASDLEGLGATETERRNTANFLANHIRNVSVTIDGKAVSSINKYRVTSPQFTFQAPTPWIFGSTGGAGNAVADGYYLMLSPLSAGTHTIHLSGEFHFAIAEGDPFDFDAQMDITYRITVQ